MVRTVETFQTKDGKIFNFKNAANMHERVQKLNDEIDTLPIDDKSKKYMKNNWQDIVNLIRRFDNITPTMNVPDCHNPAAVMAEKNKVSAPKTEKRLAANRKASTGKKSMSKKAKSA